MKPELQVFIDKIKNDTELELTSAYMYAYYEINQRFLWDTFFWLSISKLIEIEALAKETKLRYELKISDTPDKGFKDVELTIYEN